MVIDPLFVDTYSEDLNGQTPTLLPELIATGAPWHGWLGKVSEGGWYSSPADWLSKSFAAAKDTPRLSIDWFIGSYMYANFASNPQISADLYLKNFEAAGGNWAKGSGFLNPIIDVESADNSGATASQVIDHVSTLVTYLTKQTGREVWIYGGSLMYDLGISTTFGANGLWFPRYTATLPPETVTRIGWTMEQVILWQYTDTAKDECLANYPRTSPIGDVDLSALIINDSTHSGIEYLINHC